MTRGIFFSIDAVLALLIAFSLSAFILNAISQLPEGSVKQNIPLKVAEDSLISMEITGTLRDSIESSSASPIRQFASIIPNNICYRILVYTQSEQLILSEENCACKTYSVSRRSFVLGNSEISTYFAEMRACYK